jgi:hypothetical protein
MPTMPPTPPPTMVRSRPLLTGTMLSGSRYVELDEGGTSTTNHFQFTPREWCAECAECVNDPTAAGESPTRQEAPRVERREATRLVAYYALCDEHADAILRRADEWRRAAAAL